MTQRELTIWPTQDANAPKLAVDGDRWAVVAWGREGVRLAFGDLSDLKEPEMPEPVEPKPPEPNITKVDVEVDGSTLRAVATVEGWTDQHWIIWRVASTAPNTQPLVKVDDWATTVENVAPGRYHVTAELVLYQSAMTARTVEVVPEPIKPEPPKEVLPWIDIRMTIPTPGSGPNAAMLDSARLKAIADIDPDLVGRYNLDFRRRLDSVHHQVELYARFTPVEKHIPIIDWSETGTAPDPGVDPQAVADFAVMVVRMFGFRFVELGNEVWQKDTPTSEYFRVAVPVAQALLAQTDCKVGICCDYADYGSGKRRSMVDVDGLDGFLDDDTDRLIACVHPYPNPANNRISLREISDQFFGSTVYATEWGVKNTDVAGLKAGLDALRRANIPLVSLYAYDDGPPDYMGLLREGHVRTATGDLLTLYIHQMRKDHGRELPPDPVVPPDPIQVKPVIPAAKDMSGDYLNGYADFNADPGRALFLLPGFSRPERQRMLSVYAGKYPGGAVPFGAYGGYHGLNEFDYRSDPAGLINVIEDVHAAGCKPILFCFADNFGAKQWDFTRCLLFVQDYLPKIVLALGDDPFLVLSWEGEQSLDVLARTRQDDTNPWIRWTELLQAIRRVCPRGELGIHLPPREWSPLIRHTGEKTYAGMRQIPVDPNAVLVRMRTAGATALLIQWDPNDSDEHIVMEGHISAAGPGAKPDGGIARRVVDAGLKFYHFEARRTAESARRLSDKIKALNNPHVSGGANGWTR